MLNEVINELSEYRVEVLMRRSAALIADDIWRQLEDISHGAALGPLQGLADGQDWVAMMYYEAVKAAELTAVIVYGDAARLVSSLTSLTPVDFDEVKASIAKRVATAILVLHGMKG